MKMTSKMYIERSAQLVEIARETGAQRSTFEKARAERQDDFLFNFWWAGEIYSFTGAGNLISYTGNRRAEGYVNMSQAEMQVPVPIGAVPGNKKVGNFVMPTGVCLIVAPGGGGKTPIAHALAAYGKTDEQGYEVARIGEPLSGYITEDYPAGLEVAACMMRNPDVVVDSIKDLLSMGGNLMKSGLSRDVLRALTRWSVTAEATGNTLYTPMNPSSTDAEVYDLLKEASISNGVMTMYQINSTKWGYSVRRGEGLPRETGTAFVEFKGPLPTISFTKDSRTSDGISIDEFRRIEEATAYIVPRSGEQASAVNAVVRRLAHTNN